ncbi:MAG: hypothetical protein AB1690_10730 [Candidatus Zixiibacteriota bacterium]
MPLWRKYLIQKSIDMAIMFVGLAANGFLIYESFDREGLDIYFIPAVLGAAAIIYAIKWRWKAF